MRNEILLAIALSMSLTAHADFAPSVWAQLQMRGVRTLQAKITSLEMNGSQTRVGFREAGVSGSGHQEMDLCESLKEIELFRRAYDSGEILELGFQGPWSPCISSVRIGRSRD